MPVRAKIKGKTFNITRSNRDGKKYKATPVNGNGPSFHFGASGMRMKPGTQAGDSYCARSSGIKTSKNIGPNDFARWAWNCKGKKSTGKNFKLRGL